MFTAVGLTAVVVTAGLYGVGVTADRADGADQAATVTVGPGPAGVALSPTGTNAYVTNNESSTVSVIDLSTNTVTATVTVGHGPVGVAVNQAGTDAYVTNSQDGTVSVIDLSTNTVTATVTVGRDPAGVAVNQAGTDAYVTNDQDGTVSVIDLSTTTVTNTITGFSSPFGVAVNPAGTDAYITNADVTNYEGGTVSVIDLSTDAVTKTLTGFNYPEGVAVNPDGNHAYVTNYEGGTVSVIDLSTDAVTKTLTGFNYPEGVAVNPDGNHAYVTNRNNGTVSVIDLSTNAVTATIAVGAAPSAVAVNPAGTDAYVANFSSGTMSVAGITPALLPGTPGTPTAVAGDSRAIVTVTSPTTGGTPTSYTVTAVDTTTAGHGGQTCTVAGASGSCTLGVLYNRDAYTFTSTATIAAATSPPSAPSAAVTPQLEPSPGTPGQPTAFAGNAQATVFVSAPTTDDTATSYTVTAIDTTTAGHGGQTCRVSGNFGSCDITGLTNGDTYTFTSTASNIGGDSPASPASDPVFPAAVPGTPGQPSAVAGDAHATVTVTAPTSGGVPVSYTVTSTDTANSANGGQTCTVAGATGSCTQTGLTDGDSYLFTTTATDAGGTSPASVASTAVTPQVLVPGIPGRPAAVGGDAQATVTVTPPTTGGTPASYTVTAATTASHSGPTCTVTRRIGSCTLTGLTNGDIYTFTTTATNPGGTSPPSPRSAPVIPDPAVATVAITHAHAHGYLTVTNLGNVIAHGAAWHGSPHASHTRLDGPIVGIAAETDGGYIVVTTAGNVFTYDTAFYGSPQANRSHLTSPIVGVAAGTHNGYVLVTAAGSIYAYHTPVTAPPPPPAPTSPPP